MSSAQQAPNIRIGLVGFRARGDEYVSRVIDLSEDLDGVHVNLSGAGVTASAGNVANAIRLIEFLAGDDAQRTYAEVVNEYPVKPGVPWSEAVAAWGTFKADDLNLAVLGENNAEAVRIADRAGWQ